MENLLKISDGYPLIIYPEDFSLDDSYFTAELYTRDDGVKVPMKKNQILRYLIFKLIAMGLLSVPSVMFVNIFKPDVALIRDKLLKKMK